ncbi:hypothetical protein DB313_05310 (plasmid) [Borrelia turcica IST7]|uniref:Uncharacterized protein n=1 Tax=Borrelia turcica IST7 TaxID=1104446 RepID=A0A386PPN9_9SPIR|nr:hypothetical protein [Borrelia turcica]AYE36919.1 hypothetical protein DB313_05310 [Borrelia turcica IST7]
MIIKNNIYLYTCKEIKNILDEKYQIHYSIEGISTKFQRVDAEIKIGKSAHIPEEFIRYLFINMNQKKHDIVQIKEKIRKRKEEIKLMLNYKELIGNSARNSKDKTRKHKIKDEATQKTITKLIKKIYNKTHII